MAPSEVETPGRYKITWINVGSFCYAQVKRHSSGKLMVTTRNPTKQRPGYFLDEYKDEEADFEWA